MVPACFFALLGVLSSMTKAVTPPVSLHLESEEGDPSKPTLPFFLGGNPSDDQIHAFSPGIGFAAHTARGKGLHDANVGVPASFDILLVDEEDAPPHDQWNAVSNKLFMYVWIANEDQIFFAEVVNNGNGTLTATYESSFPGTYSVHIEVVTQKTQDEGVPIVGSPFTLSIQGEPSLNIDALPVCGTEEEEIARSFWRPGTWLSSNLASASHGVMRNGWVFQPKSCVYDTFSFEDLMLLANKKEPTWILILGGSVQRGVFLNLVDMALAQGQKDNLKSSAIGKCWGYADIQIGNLRLTYQDFRLHTIAGVQDATVCNNEKLKSGSTGTFVHSCKKFLEWEIFQEGTHWPSVIFAPSGLGNRNTAGNLAIEVMMGALPASWRGILLIVEHMAGLGAYWDQENPTRTSLKDIGMSYLRKHDGSDCGYEKMSAYQDKDPRTTFMSVFPMYQSKLFENEYTKGGKRWYGGNQHLHYVSTRSSVETYHGSKLVHSTMTEMISNILVGKAVGTKEALYADSGIEREVTKGSATVPETFQMCTDCPSSLLPLHVQPRPNIVCNNISAFPGNAPMGEVWDKELCPEWCMETAPVSQTPTESGPVDVRICPVEESHP